MAKILIIDDNIPSRELLIILLNQNNYKTISADNSEEGLLLAENQLPDLIIADISIPKIGGCELVKKLRALDKTTKIPIIFYTSAYSEKEASKIVQSCGVKAVLSKPIKPAIILNVINQALELNPTKTNNCEDFQSINSSAMADKLAEKISELEKTKLQLKQIRQRHDLTLNSISEGICEVNTEGKAVFINQVGTKILGWPLEEILGHTQHDRVHHSKKDGSSHSIDECLIHKTLRDGVTRFCDYEVFWRKDGSFFPVEYTCSAIFEDNKISSVIVTFRDITERKQMIEALAQEQATLAVRVQERTADLWALNNELIKASRLKDEFLASMSHELRTPLNVILGMSELLKEQVYGSANAKQLKVITSIEESGQHLLSLINDILDLSKINAGKIELEFGVVETTSFCEGCLGLVKQLAHKKSIKISVQTDPVITTFIADSRRLKQALVNLLSNAIKFTPENGSIGLQVFIGENGHSLNFAVWDSGIGIAPENMDKLFKPFVQIDSSLAREHSGTGLGLSLVHAICELHGGGISLQSEVNKGSRFTISLPWHKANPKEKSTTKIIKNSDIFFVRKALVIEDSSSSAEQISRYLSELGANTITSGSGLNTVEKTIEINPDVIILDLLLPDISGWTVLRELKANESTKNIPVIIISIMDERSRGLSLGATEYLVKPINREQVILALRKITYTKNLITTKALTNNPLLLIAEDNELNLDIVSDYLSSKNHRFIIAKNGKEAISQTLENKPDLILMDIQMPGMDGLEAIEKIRQIPEIANTPIIAMTALAMAGDRERCLVAGANEYISKPLNLPLLLKLIQQLLENKY